MTPLVSVDDQRTRTPGVRRNAPTTTRVGRKTSTVDLAAALVREYGLDARSIEPSAGGFEAECFVVDEEWFVKVWRRPPPANLGLLDHLARRGLPVAPPVRTLDGRLIASNYAVFPFVRGHHLQEGAVDVLARTVRRVHAVTDIDLPRTTMDEWCIPFLREHLDHPWVADRRAELAAAVDRLDVIIDRARRIKVPHVLVHNDLYGDNILVDDAGEVVAILDWDHACLAPPEHDLWMAADDTPSSGLLAAYGATDLDPTHLEYALLARALRDLAVRVRDGVDREGIWTWGFRRLARVDTVLATVR